MIDVAEPDESYSVARYVEEADACVRGILNRGRLPIVVGGTGLYIDSLIGGRFFAGGEPEQQLRRELNALYDSLGGERLLERLRAIDPAASEKLHASDKKRIVRALEVFESTGKTITEHNLETQRLPPRYDAVKIALSFEDRQMLYDRIDLRVDEMMERGLLGEVRSLLERGLAGNKSAMQAIGYKELAAHLRGELGLVEAVETIKRESRRYAKRQLTWLRRGDGLNWILWGNKPDFAQARRSSAKILLARGLK
jgi:tRNA dimethylallyltransferase